MEAVSRILKNTKNIKHQFLILEILLKCFYDVEQKKKYDYLYNKYLIMLQDIDNYSRKINDENSLLAEIHMLYNQVTNDYETINSLLEEMKEDIYPLVKPSPIVLLDNMNNDELSEVLEKVNYLLMLHRNVESVNHYIYDCGYVEVRTLVNKILTFIENFDDEAVKRLLPVKFFESVLEERLNTYSLWQQVYNNIKFTIKYVKEAESSLLDEIKVSFKSIEIYYFFLMLEEEKLQIVVEDANV